MHDKAPKNGERKTMNEVKRASEVRGKCAVDSGSDRCVWRPLNSPGRLPPSPFTVERFRPGERAGPSSERQQITIDRSEGGAIITHEASAGQANCFRKEKR
jgi:hypothetical protein